MRLLNRKTLKLLGLLLLFSGCASLTPVISVIETGNKTIEDPNLSQIKKGISSTKDIKDLFGEPDSILFDEKTQKTTWIYFFTKAKQSSLERAPFQIDQTELKIGFNDKDIAMEYTRTISQRARRNN